jgi:hypothetical protein
VLLYYTAQGGDDKGASEENQGPDQQSKPVSGTRFSHLKQEHEFAL